MPDTVAHPKLLALLAAGRAAEQAFVASLPAPERARVGALEQWSPKELLGHLTAWKAHTVLRLRAAVEGGQPPPVESEDAFNNARFAADQPRSWDEVLVDSERAYTDLVAALERCSEADLTDPHRFPWTGGRALIGSVIGNGYAHPGDHLTQYYLDAGDTARATAVQQGMAQTTQAIFGPSEATAAALYNLGCFYARTGAVAQALEPVRQALQMSPALVPWSREDPDLVPLHGDPAFEALTAG